MMKDGMEANEIFFTALVLVCYAIAAALVRKIVFEVFPRVPEAFWNDVYWCVAGAGFVLVLQKMMALWREE